ncbi:peptidase S8/S53 domain-containing protein [Chaetomidium leptoderma]|uniref:Peptidase S8/S53 domain-containing protein n=1 Tax=Chaetomidium leptoderma TaxID=669021 RepID=A0AAN6ZWX9_9PEZI|nr:peptidase S8/S53 domain-containing protein [Chaetomidium leptoderma]
MRIPVLYHALSVFALWASTSDAQQQQQPRIALKLNSAAHEKQQADPNFIANLIQKAEPQGFRFSAPRVSVNPLIAPQRSANISARVAGVERRNTGLQVPNFDAWYQIQVGSEGAQARSVDSPAANTTGTEEPRLALPKNILDLIHELHKLPEVESAHALHPGPPPAVNPNDDPRSVNQGYLDAAPKGINVRYAWGFPGGDGAGVNIVDMEQGWNLNHEDLAAAGITLISGHNAYWFSHGTSVLGEMFMVDNQLGGVGIVPAAKGRVVSQHRDDWSYSTPAAILDAVAHLSFGDILLLEAQEYDPVSGVYYWPVEVADANYEAIQVATALGITVVEAGCNGANDLDQYISLSGKRIFDRSSPDYRESGAIMVGGANSWVPHTRWYGSNYGSRMDVYAWAEGVDTAETDDVTGTENWYTSWFGGTSGASPIIVGAAAIIQGISNATLGVKMGPLELRSILATNGTASDNPAVDRIGVMPDLQAIIDSLFGSDGQTPDLYIRDHVGDSGDTTSGAVSASPDIIVRQQPLADPEAALGPGSGTENNPALSEAVQAGRDHSIYIRLLNRGNAAASSATTTVYWSEPATLVTPNLWHEIGTVSFPHSIPTDNTLTISGALPWPAASVPGTSGHYCFVALAGALHDPVPAVPTTSFPDFVKFIRENNNAAWRNFNVISAPPSLPSSNSSTPVPPPAFHNLPVTIPGAFDAPREFTIKAVGSLPPQGSQVRLRVPRALARSLGIKGAYGDGGEGEEAMVVVGLPPAAGTVVLGRGELPAGSLARCELQVRVPEGTYEVQGGVDFALMQEWEGVEVGRVTWRFGAAGGL